jgi:hypothetical protein
MPVYLVGDESYTRDDLLPQHHLPCVKSRYDTLVPLQDKMGVALSAVLGSDYE